MKCLYCDGDNPPTHFICEVCGNGMCEECYNKELEHDEHYCFPEELAEDDDEYILLLGVFKGGYACQSCLDEALGNKRSTK